MPSPAPTMEPTAPILLGVHETKRFERYLRQQASRRADKDANLATSMVRVADFLNKSGRR